MHALYVRAIGLFCVQRAPQNEGRGDSFVGRTDCARQRALTRTSVCTFITSPSKLQATFHGGNHKNHCSQLITPRAFLLSSLPNLLQLKARSLLHLSLDLRKQVYNITSPTFSPTIELSPLYIISSTSINYIYSQLNPSTSIDASSNFKTTSTDIQHGGERRTCPPEGISPEQRWTNHHRR